MTQTTEYVVITTTEYYGPKTTHAIHRDDDGDKQLPIFDSTEAAFAAVPDQSGPIYLGHNEVSHDTSVWEVVQEVDPRDWQSWPDEMLEAACEIARGAGIDPEDAEACLESEIDWASEAANAVDMCVVARDNGDCLLCKRVDD